MADADTQRIRLRAARLSVAVGLAMLALKWAAYLLTGSTSVLSDALESVVHVGAVLVMLGMLRLAATPPDHDHPYGHGKAEYLSVGFEGGMVALAGLAVYWEAARTLWKGEPISDAGLGLVFTAAAAVINLALGWHLLRIGRRTASRILVADGHHVLSDVWTSAGALVGLALAAWTGLTWIDRVVALVLATYVCWTGASLVRQAIHGLMDQTDRQLLLRVVAAINEIRDPAWIDVHNLRARVSGDFAWVDLHLTVPADWRVDRAHGVVEGLEHHILERLGRQGAVMIHLDYPHEGPETPTPITLESAIRMKDDGPLGSGPGADPASPTPGMPAPSP